MTPLVPVALALLAAAPGKDIELEADKLVSDPARHLLTGHAVLRTDDSVLRADEIVYFKAEQVAKARGRVTVALSSGGLFGAVAEGVTMKLEGRRVKELFVERGLIMQKIGLTSTQLFAVATPAQMEQAGHTSLTLAGTRLARGEGDLWIVDDLELTPCDCPADEAGIRVEAPRARVRLDDRRASIAFPTVHVKTLPVFWLPWIDIPLSPRSSGLLVPRPSWSKNGFGLDLPVFWAIDRSYDATFTPGFFTGVERAIDGSPILDGVTGPRLHTEFRYAPREGTTGRATLGLIYDLRPQRDPITRSRMPFNVPRGPRGEGSLSHTQDLGAGWFDRVDASFVSDGFYRNDLAADILAREDAYLRSTGMLFRRSDELFAGLEVGLIQDLRWGYRLFGGDVDRSGAPVRGPSTLQRLPALVVALPERPLAGPVHAGLRAEFTRHSPIVSSTGDEGPAANEGRLFATRPDGTRVWLPTPCLSQRLFFPEALSPPQSICQAGVAAPDKKGQADGLFQPGEREARDRFDFRPRLSAAFGLGGIARLTPYAAFREDVYLGEVTGKASHRGYPLGGVVLDTEIGRAFGQGQGALWHSVAPTLELRYVPLVFGDEPAPYDDLDVALPSGGRMLHAIAELRQALVRRTGLSSTEVLRLDLGQGADLFATAAGDRLRDSFARLSFSLSPLRVFGLLRVDPTGPRAFAEPQLRIAQASAGIWLDAGRGAGVSASYDHLFNEGSDRTRRGVDALVGPPPIGFQPDFAQQLGLGFHARVGLGFGIDYSAMIARTTPPPDPITNRTADSVLSFRQQQLGVSYGPNCNCWRIEAHALHQPIREKTGDNYLVFPTLGASLTVTGFGTVGTGG